LEFETMNKIRSRGHRQIGTPSNGLVEFWAPVLLSNISFSHRQENFCSLYVEPPPGSLNKVAVAGSFRFDDLGEKKEVDELVAILVSPGIISCIGVVRKDEETFTRIGIGSIYGLDDDYVEFPTEQNLLGGPKKTLWEIRLIRMC
jgi:hypothetical protein